MSKEKRKDLEEELKQSCLFSVAEKNYLLSRLDQVDRTEFKMK